MDDTDAARQRLPVQGLGYDQVVDRDAHVHGKDPFLRCGPAGLGTAGQLAQVGVDRLREAREIRAVLPRGQELADDLEVPLLGKVPLTMPLTTFPP